MSFLQKTPSPAIITTESSSLSIFITHCINSSKSGAPESAPANLPPKYFKSGEPFGNNFFHHLPSISFPKPNEFPIQNPLQNGFTAIIVFGDTVRSYFTIITNPGIILLNSSSTAMVSDGSCFWSCPRFGHDSLSCKAYLYLLNGRYCWSNKQICLTSAILPCNVFEVKEIEIWNGFFLCCHFPYWRCLSSPRFGSCDAFSI